MEINITDPTEVNFYRQNFFNTWISTLLNDDRDLVFIHLCLKIIFIIIPYAIILFIFPTLNWLFYVGYLILLLVVFLGPYMLMLHNVCHRKLFKKKHSTLNKVIPSLIGLFFGQTPETYFYHHVTMHHPENNEVDDLSSTMNYQRDSIGGFLYYLVSFYFTGVANLALYFTHKKRNKFALRIVLGEMVFIILSITFSFFNFKAALTIFILPLVFIRFAMMAGNWAQHAFIDPDNPGNVYGNSITCINSIYNKKCFNDGYHIGHHLRPYLHWTEMPLDFHTNMNLYRQHNAIIFSGLDYFQIWFFLMTKNYKKLTAHFVKIKDWTDDAEIIQFLKTRTRKILIL